MIKVVHFINQFYAGFGSEEFADMPIDFVDGPKGPGLAFQKELGDRASIIATIWSGDNFSNEHKEEFLEKALAFLEDKRPDVIIAGPAFNSGRYGMACAGLLIAAREKLGIPGVVGLGPDNPGNEFRKQFWVVPTSLSSAGMRKAVPPMARIALKLGGGLELGPAAEEGYLPRGYRQNVFVGVSGAVRAVDMALARLKGEKWETELPQIAYDVVEPPAPVRDLAGATVALVCEGSVVPLGNPDHLETWNSTKWLKYDLPEETMEAGKWEARHGGYITDMVHADPNRMVPLNVFRTLEREGAFKKLYDEYLVTTGNMTNVSTMRRIGHEMGVYLKQKGVDAVILTCT